MNECAYTYPITDVSSVQLTRRRTGFKDTDRLLNRLIVLVIETGLATGAPRIITYSSSTGDWQLRNYQLLWHRFSSLSSSSTRTTSTISPSRSSSRNYTATRSSCFSTTAQRSVLANRTFISMKHNYHLLMVRRESWIGVRYRSTSIARLTARIWQWYPWQRSIS